MTADNSLRSAVLAAIVAAVISAAGIGIFAATRGEQTADTTQVASAPPQDALAIEKMVREYLVKNPEILIEMSQALEERQSAAQETALRSAIAANADAIFRSGDDLIAGNPQGDVTVVEFFDYNCAYCKRAMPELIKLIENDGNVRVVLKEFPILRRESEGAARVAIAAAKQGKYFELHRALLEANGVASEQTALTNAAEIGLDVERLKQDMQAPEVEKVIKGARELADKLGVQGTPFYLIGDQVVPGAPSDLYDQFVAKVAEIRKNGCGAPVTC